MSLLKLPDNFISEETDDKNWEYISGNYELSEDFIEKHFDKLDLSLVFSCQKLSDKFIKKHWMSIASTWLNKNKYCSRRIKFWLCDKRSMFYIKKEIMIKSKRLFFRKKFIYA